MTCATLRHVKLGELIESRKRELGLSYDKLVASAQARGFDMTKATLAAYATKPLLEAPKTRTMEAIATALDVGYTEVVLAVAESLIGTAPVEVSNLQHVNSWLTITSGRSDDQVSRLLRIVRTVSAAIDAEAHAPAQGQAPQNGGDPTATGSLPRPEGEPDSE